MSFDFESAYQTLAPFYKAFLSGRGHINKQKELLLNLLTSYKIAKNARILDAACGTGDVIFELRKNGYVNAYGVDASTPMLNQSLDCKEVSDNCLQVCRWQDLNRVFAEQGKYDFVFILGHALPHANRTDIPNILRHIFNGLNAGGVFCFDLRPWGRGADGSLIQEGRTPGEWRPTASFEIGGYHYEMHEICSYEAGRQNIRYRIQRLIEATEEAVQDTWLEVSYELFDADEASLWLKEAGFRKVTSRRFSEWPSYVTVVAQK